MMKHGALAMKHWDFNFEMFVQWIVGTIINWNVILMGLSLRTDPDVCPDPMFSRAKRLSRPADPDKVSPGPLARILGFPNFAVSA